MADDLGPGAIVGWLRAHGTDNGLAGAAFLIGPDLVLTCAHVIGAHLGLTDPLPEAPPAAGVTIRFEALDIEASGHVVPNGWFRNATPRPTLRSDIAVIRLTEQLEIAQFPAIAQRLPMQILRVFVHGAGAGFQSYGQQVQGDMAGSNLPNGRRQIDPKDTARGFTVKRGFSGSPVLDDVGNVVWGMVAAVVEDGIDVAYAIPANDLRHALDHAGVEAEARFPDATDAKAEDAMRALRAEYEGQLANAGAETERVRQELDRLRQGVRELDREARAQPQERAGAALEALAVGNAAPAAEVLRRRLDERLVAADTARKEAAAAARQLGAVLKLTDAAGALAAYRQAAECEPAAFWTWIEVCRLEQTAGTLGGAEQAAKAAQRAADDDRSHAVAQYDLGDIQLARGNLAAALESYRAFQEAVTRLAADDPANTTLQGDLSTSHIKVGDVLRAQGDPVAALTSYQASLAIAERLAKADPGNAGRQRELSVSHNKIGNAQRAQGNLAAALTSYQADLGIAERLAKADPGNAGWQSDLSVSYSNVGDVQQIQGELTAALTSQRTALAIRERLANADPANAGWQRNLALSLGRVAEVQVRQGARAEALRAFQQARAIITRLRERSPDNATLPNDLAWYDAQIAALSP